MSRIQLTGLTKVFGGAKRSDGVRALDAVDLDVGDHEMVVLLGPSGCGKTTMLRCIAGLEQPTGGEIRIGGQTVYSDAQGIDTPPNRRDLGMVFQSYALWPHMTVAGNVAYPLKRRKTPNAKIGPLVSDALDAVDCVALVDRYPHELSGGQQQRVSLARALVAEPKVLLFDEPLSNLDASLRDRMRVEIRAVQKRSGYTSVYVTHDQKEALAIADRLVVMSGGRILQAGSPNEMYSKPKWTFVAEFLGASNIVPVERRVGANEIETACGRLWASSGSSTEIPMDVAVSASIRPESISLGGDDEGSAGGNQVKARLRVAEFLGDHVSAIFDVNGVELRAKLPATSSVQHGEYYGLSVAIDDVRLVRDDHAE